MRQAGDVVAVMSDEHGFTLTLANARRFGGEPPRYPEAFHVGFVLDSPADVDAAYARLAAANVPLDRAPGRQHGNYGFYFTALNGILFEVQCLFRAASADWESPGTVKRKSDFMGAMENSAT